MPIVNLRARLQILLVVIAAVAVGTSGWFGYVSGRDSLERVALDRLVIAREFRKQQIESSVAVLVRDAEGIARMHSVEELLLPHPRTERGVPPPCQQILREYLTRTGCIECSVRDADGKLLCMVRGARTGNVGRSAIDDSPSVPPAVGQNEPAGSGAATMLDVHRRPGGGETLAFGVAVPVGSEGGAHGTLVLLADADTLNRLMTGGGRWFDEGLGTSGETYVVGSDSLMRTTSRFHLEDPVAYSGRFAVAGGAPERADMIRQTGSTALLQHVRTDAVRAALQGRVGTTIGPDYRGVDVYSAYTPLHLPGVSWVLVAEIDCDEAMRPVAALRNRLVGTAAVILGVAALAGLFMARRITRPLATLARAAEDFGAGDLTHRAVPESSDELGELARSFNRMATNFSREIEERRQAEDQLRASREQFRELTAHLQSIREEERTRIARDVHDDLGQYLTTLKLDLALLKQEVQSGDAEAHQRINEMSVLVDGTIRSVKRIITELRPRLLDDLGLTAAIEWLAADFEKRTGVSVHCSMYPPEIILDAQRSTVLFRIVQEALLNVARHAGASDVTVGLTEIDGVVDLDIRDNGRGITPGEIQNTRSFGLMGIRERAESLGGSVTIAGAPGEGTRLTVRFTSGDEERGE